MPPPRLAWRWLRLGVLGAATVASTSAEPQSATMLQLQPHGLHSSTEADVEAAVSLQLSRLDAGRQQQLLGRLACLQLRSSGDALVQAACDAAAEPRHALRELAVQQWRPASPRSRFLAAAGAGSSGSGGGSGSGSGGCPYKHESTEETNREHLELMVVAVIFITVLIEVVTHRVDHIAKTQEYIFQIVQRVYKELMLLGIISFMLFLFESNACLSPDLLHDLHIIHILIFYISLVRPSPRPHPLSLNPQPPSLAPQFQSFSPHRPPALLSPIGLAPRPLPSP